jgi:hypothetical protein
MTDDITHRVPRASSGRLRCMVQVDEGGMITWEGNGFVTLTTKRDDDGNPTAAFIEVNTWQPPARERHTLYSLRIPTRTRLPGRLILMWRIITGRVSDAHVDSINYVTSEDTSR